MPYYYGWGIRHPCFLTKLLESFTSSTHGIYTVNLLGERLLTRVFKTQNGVTERIPLKYEYTDECKQLETINQFPIMFCGLPDGKYIVKDAFYANMEPYFMTVKDGNYNDKEMAIAGAYMWWCVESNNPTGDRTYDENLYSEWYDYHFGPCGELYTVHDMVESVDFDLDKKTVTLKTRYQF